VRFADQIAPRITFVNPPANKFVAMLAIYAVSSFGVWMVFRVVRNAIDRVKMDGFDHQMGAILGFARGVLWCVGVTFFAVTLLPAAQKRQIVNSRSGYYIARLIDETDSVFPPEIHQVVGPYLDRLGTELNGAGPPGSSSGPAPSGWPSGESQPSQQPAPAWGESAPAKPAPAWPGSQPTQGSGWPQADAAPSAPAASEFGWPSADKASPATPATQASWPEWD